MSVHRLNKVAPKDAAPHKRQANSETISRLQRGILRMSFAYHGQNTDLDQKLKEVGSLLRGGQRDTRLNKLIDQIVESVCSMDHKLVTGPENTDCDPLLQFFDQLAAPESIQGEIDSARKLIIEQKRTVEVIAQIEKAARAISSELDSHRNPTDEIETARGIMIELMERVPITGQLADDATALKRTLLKASDTAELKPCVAALVQLIQNLRAELQGEIDGLAEFLRTTAQRLQDCEQVMTRSRELHVAASNDAVQLSETVCMDICVLREDVSESEDLEVVKSMIESKLNSIGDGLNDFINAQKERTTEADGAIELMVHRLKHLEEETKNLRENLAEQHARVLIDPLTGILNRSGYLETAGKQYARWKRYGGAMSLAVIDLDRFKDINDRYGHSAGDKVLTTVVNNLNEKMRESDILCRYGGEEFVLIMPETTARDAVMLLDKLRAHIENCAFRYKDTPVPVTLSCGIAQFHARDTLEEVFERADRAMYAAKDNGRNQVCTEPHLKP